MPFQFETYHSPFANSIADLILRKGDAAARAAEQTGQIYGNMIANVGQNVGTAIAQATDPQRKLQAIALQQAQRQQGGQQALASAMQSRVPTGPQPEGEAMPPAQNPYLKQEGDVSVWDVEGLSKAMAAQGYGDLAPGLVKDISALNQAHREESSARQQLAAAQQNVIAKGAGTALSVLRNHPDMDPSAVVGLVTQQMQLNKTFAPQELQQVTASLLSDPSQLGAKLEALSKAGTQAPIKVGEKDRLVNPNDPSGPSLVGAAPPELKPEAGVVFKDAQGVERPVFASPDGKFLVRGMTGQLQDVTTQVTRPTAAPPTAQAKSYRVKGVGDVPLEFVPGRTANDPGAYFLNKPDGTRQQLYPGKDFVDVPPASIQVNASNAAEAEKPITAGSKDYRAAQDLAYGKLTFQDFTRLYPSRGSGPQAALRSKIYDTARALNPNFDPAQFELGFKMASNPQMRQRLVAIDALGPVIDQIDALVSKSGNTSLPALNAALNAAKFQVGDKTVTSFKQLQTLLGDEVGNALGVGTGSDLKTKLGLDLVNPNLSPSNFAATMDQVRSVLGARRDVLLKTMGPYGGASHSAADAPKFSVGDVVQVGGKKIKISAIHPDGTFDGSEVNR